MMELTDFPLIPPRYTFKASLIAGTTPVGAGGLYDYFIQREHGMKGFVMHLTVQGEGIVKNGGEEYTCRPGDLLLFPPGTEHHYGRKEDCAAWIHQWVYFHPRHYWKDMLTWSEICGKVSFFRPSDRYMQDYYSLFNQIVNAGRSQLQHKQLLALNLLEQILLRRIDETWCKTDIMLDERVSAVCMYITENLSDSARCSIDLIAAHINLSRSRILHLFRQQMGVSIFQWRDDQRMIVARRLLSETRLPISNIADQVGFDDQLYFSKVFRKYTGCSPTEYRLESQMK